ncbi:MAG: 6,7-dimethyl-8-ribityllumazine synthase [Planctomycetota bacterium]|nr:6,7-dimethyl-8-ribityllumazine synthase [Planctomycetota bacterium]
MSKRMYTQITSSSDASGLRIGLALSQYHDEITSKLRDGAIQQFFDQGGKEENLVLVPAPGAFELIATCKAFAQRDSIDAAVALACVITGETPHDQYINQAIVHGISTIICDSGMPIGFGVLTCLNLEQAHARAGGEVGNKGAEAMAAAIEMANTIRALRESEGGE